MAIAAGVGLLLGLRSAQADAITGHATPRATAVAMRAGLAASIVDWRQRARVAGVQRLHSELLELGAADLAASIQRTGLKGYIVDLRRAERAAHGTSWRWLRKVEAADVPDVVAMRTAARAEQHSLRRIAITESAQAFNVEREEILYESRVARVIHVMKVWDAQLDACPKCRAADGTVVELDEPFPDGTPGSVHPLCRCISSVLPVEFTR